MRSSAWNMRSPRAPTSPPTRGEAAATPPPSPPSSTRRRQPGSSSFPRPATTDSMSTLPVAIRADTLTTSFSTSGRAPTMTAARPFPTTAQPPWISSLPAAPSSQRSPGTVTPLTPGLRWRAPTRQGPPPCCWLPSRISRTCRLSPTSCRALLTAPPSTVSVSPTAASTSGPPLACCLPSTPATTSTPPKPRGRARRGTCSRSRPRATSPWSMG
mmetsp:Transcript_37300/g.117371  ORF Transcript_37300/g.117371 Transcript_37300/m.117371 type:complete len:214 (+) Transcript_37300:917-1558(+)